MLRYMYNCSLSFLAFGCPVVLLADGGLLEVGRMYSPIVSESSAVSSLKLYVVDVVVDVVLLLLRVTRYHLLLGTSVLVGLMLFGGPVSHSAAATGSLRDPISLAVGSPPPRGGVPVFQGQE